MNINMDRKKKVFAYFTGLLTGMICLAVVPLIADGNLAKQYYQIIVGNQAYGCYESSQEATKELNHIRAKLEKEQGGQVLTTVSCSVEPVEKIRLTSSMHSVEEDLYKVLEKNVELC